MGWKC